MIAPATRLYYWLHHTGLYDGNSGVQRVVRALGGALLQRRDVELVPVRWCARREAIVRADKRWVDGLAGYSGPIIPEPAGSGEALHLCALDKPMLDGAWLLLPEVTHLGGIDSPGPALAVALDYARYHGLRSAAVFYDLIPLRVAGYESMREVHGEYARALAAADLILPISRTAGADLGDWWREIGHDPARLPPIRPVPLAMEMPGVPRAVPTAEPEPRPGEETRLLMLGTVEPRKNQLAVIEAVNRLAARRPDLAVSLDVVGHLHPAVAEAARRAEAHSCGRVRLHGYLPDGQTAALTRDCQATVFVSLAEGYGLPISESLWLGKPCLCSGLGSMAEIAQGGGCLIVDPHDPAAIERAVERLADDPTLRGRLEREALGRPLKSWVDYGGEVLAALHETPMLRRVVVIEGSLGGAEPTAAALRAARVVVAALRWRGDSGALIPGFGADHAVAPGEGRAGPVEGDLRGQWAILPLATTAGPAEAMRIEDEARALGLKLALLVPAGLPIGRSELAALATVDLAMFGSDGERDAALDAALLSLPRTATLRHRFRTAADTTGLLAALASQRPRISAAGVPQPVRRIYYWAGLTATQPFNTGIQRVTRSLGAALVARGIELVAVKWDAASAALVPLDAAESEALAMWGGPPARVAEPLPLNLRGEWLLIPELVIPVLPAGSTPARLGRSLGMHVAAIFYDAIPLKLAKGIPGVSVEHFTDWLETFADVDVALPISWTVAGDLRRFLASEGLPVPTIMPIALAGDLPGLARAVDVHVVPAAGEPLRLLAVGTWEPRKNYPRLLRALIEARRLSAGREIELTIVGRRDGRLAHDAEIEGLAAQAGRVTLFQHVTDEEVAGLFQNSHATVFASWEEGFGLPVLESLWRGLPCLCHDGSSLAEIAPGGGTVMVNMLDQAAIADGISRLACEEGLLARLSREAIARPIRSWDEYAGAVLAALARVGTAPGWPLPAILPGGRAGRPLLSCAVTTYNRARWLTHSLPRLIEAARPFGSAVEVVVCDNASTDATPEVVARYHGTPGFNAHRNGVNVGMLGNLGATAQVSNGAFVWLIGDDDLVADSGIGAVLDGLDGNPDVEMAYMNYAYTHFDAPEDISDPTAVLRGAKPIGYGGPNRRVEQLREVAALNENLFTAIYACAFRRDHALRAYQQDVSGPPFSSLLTCIPSSVYAIAALQDRPAWWVGQPAVVVNMNVSWLRWQLLWHLERMPDLFDAAELAGIDPVRVDRHRAKHCWNAGDWTRDALLAADDPVRQGVSVSRLIERCKHMDVFAPEAAKLFAAYEEAWVAGRVEADTLPPRDLFARYGLSGG